LEEILLIYQLMRLNPSWKAVRFLILAGVILSLSPPKFYGAAFFLVLGTAFFCLVNIGHSGFLFFLPISRRQLFAAHQFSMLAALWAQAIIISVILAFRGSEGSAAALSLLGTTALATLMAIIVPSMQKFPIQSVINTCACPIAGVVSWHSRIKRLRAIIYNILNIFVIVMMLPALFLWHYVWQFEVARLTIALVTAGCLPASAILFFRIWKRFPESYEMPYYLLNASPISAATPSPADGARADMRGSRALPWKLILRSSDLWLYFVLLLIWFLSSAVNGITFWIFLIPISLWSSTSQRNKSWLYALPISRRAFLPLFMLPLLLSIVAGYSIGLADIHGLRKQANILPTQTWPPATTQTNDKGRDIVLPIEFWKSAHAGKAPAIQAPWGEKFQPPISTVHGYRVYNPYAVGSENSQRFFDWQFARATRAAYGRSIPLSEYKYPSSLLSMVPPLRIQMLNIVMIIAGLLIVICCIEGRFWRRFWWLSKPLRMIYIVLLIASMGACAYLSPPFNETWDTLVLCISWTLPDNALIASIAVVLPLAGLYWIADKLCRVSEPRAFNTTN
jgi:hypothetical protein